MKQELRDLLLEYYGELMQERDTFTQYNWKQRESIIEKMDAIDLLMGFPKSKITNFEQIRQIIANHE